MSAMSHAAARLDAFESEGLPAILETVERAETHAGQTGERDLAGELYALRVHLSDSPLPPRARPHDVERQAERYREAVMPAVTEPLGLARWALAETRFASLQRTIAALTRHWPIRAS